MTNNSTHQHGNSEVPIYVETTFLDDFVVANNIEKIDILKMDAEGAEPLIVIGGLKPALSITERIVMKAYGLRDELTDECRNTLEIVADLLGPSGFRIGLDDRELKGSILTGELNLGLALNLSSEALI